MNETARAVADLERKLWHAQKADACKICHQLCSVHEGFAENSFEPLKLLRNVLMDEDSRAQFTFRLGERIAPV